MIVPKFNSKRIAAPGAAADAFKSLVSPLAKSRDKKVRMDVNAANKQIKEKEKAIKAQDKAAQTYIQTPIKAAKGKTLTPAEKAKNIAIRKQNQAAASYMTYKPEVVTAKGTTLKGSSAPGRPNTKASTRTVKPKATKAPKATVNKTGARNVRKATTVTPTKKVTKVAPVVGAGRRKNGAPKSR